MRRLIVLITCLLASCSPQNAATVDATNVDGEPNVNVTAAPSVAFNYRYAYNLPDSSISTVQEQHAAACEKLGVARCRITGLRYTVNKGDSVDAMLAIKLAPGLARAFGKQATATVAASDGRLVESEITGEDAGSTIAAANQTSTQAENELRTVEARLRNAKLSTAQRDALLARAAEARQRGQTASGDRAAAEASLATTPMTFVYSSATNIPGFGKIVTLREALANGWDSIAALVSFLVLAVTVVGPWLLVGFGLFSLYRRFVRPLQRPPVAPHEFN